MKELSPKEVETLLKEGKSINVVDVREDNEVAEGKIAEAVHIPLGSVESRVDEIDKSQEHVMVCRSGGRSARATE